MTEERLRNDSRPRLGRGLAALLGDAVRSSDSGDLSQSIQKVPVELLRPNPKNPRRTFEGTELAELTASIQERGIIQPILARRISGLTGIYEIVAGERRWRAAQRASLHEVPVIVLDIDERSALEIAIVENVQRTDLNAIEEALGYELLASEHHYSQADISRVVGKSRSHVANTLRLLALSDHIKALVIGGDMSAGHARALLAVEDPDSVAEKVIRDKLTVRDVESLGQGSSRAQKKRVDQFASSNSDKQALELTLAEVLGAKVTIRQSGDRGEIRIVFNGLDQLDDLCFRLKNNHKSGAF